MNQRKGRQEGVQEIKFASFVDFTQIDTNEILPLSNFEGGKINDFISLFMNFAISEDDSSFLAHGKILGT